MAKLTPIPEGEKWACLQCAMNNRDADSDTLAVVLYVEGDELWDKTGMCGNHAEVMDINNLKEAQRLFDEEVSREY